MDFSTSNLYGIKDIKTLEKILCANTYSFRDSDKTFEWYRCRIVNDGERLIEAPVRRLKEVQSRILCCLQTLALPPFYYSCAGQSNVQAAAVHRYSSTVIVKADIRKFYPFTSRDKVYKFWKHDMQMSSAVANRITNITTISIPSDSVVKGFLDSNNISTLNHLPTGSPSSQLLAFLVNLNMFEQIEHLVKTEYEGQLSVYVDDITVSGCKNPKQVVTRIRRILFSYGYRMADNKSRIVRNRKGVEILGVFISKDKKLGCPNRINEKILASRDNELSKRGVRQYQRSINAAESR